MPRSTFYYYVKKSKKTDKYAKIKEEIRAIYHENHGRYGYRRITLELKNRGYCINHKTVQRLMKSLGIKCMVRIKKYRSYKGEIGKIAPNIIQRDFSATAPNQKWTTDITEFSLLGTKLYLSPILDMFNGEIISYNISERPVLGQVMENFFGLLKSELLYLREFESLDEFKTELIKYIDYYNNKRIKSKLKGLSPVQYRLQSFVA